MPNEPEPPEPGRNKYGRWEDDVPPEVDAEICRLKNTGLNMRGISGELAKQGIFMDYMRVRGRLSAITREQNKRQKAKPPGTPAGEIHPVGGSQGQQIANLDDKTLLDMYSEMTAQQISEILAERGIELSPKEVTQRVKEAQLRETPAALRSPAEVTPEVDKEVTSEVTKEATPSMNVHERSQAENVQSVPSVQNPPEAPRSPIAEAMSPALQRPKKEPDLARDRALSDDDAEDEMILEMAKLGCMPQEIKIAIERTFGRVISTMEAKRRATELLEGRA